MIFKQYFQVQLCKRNHFPKKNDFLQLIPHKSGTSVLKKTRPGKTRPAESVPATRPDPIRAQTRQTHDPLELTGLAQARAK
jgi:hypothetical protein